MKPTQTVLRGEGPVPDVFVWAVMCNCGRHWLANSARQCAAMLDDCPCKRKKR